MLASVGLPGTSGFIGEFLIILGAIKFNAMIGVLAATTLIDRCLLHALVVSAGLL
jgi:NADH-quinone oxidoreductase subunit M